MNCSEALEFVGVIVDGDVEEDSRRAFLAHVQSCRTCRRAYELEVVAKELVRNNLPHVVTPPAVRRDIVTALQSSSVRSSSVFGLRMPVTLRRSSYVLAMAAVVVLASLLIFRSTPADDERSAHIRPGDMMVRTAANFALIRDGALKPTLVTCSPESMYGFLVSQRLPFEAVVTPLERCDGYSALVNEMEGVRVAHVIYRFGDELLYVCQVRKDDVMTDDGQLALPLAGREAVAETGWYLDPDHTGCNVVVWEEAGTICTATSTMDKTKMMALLATR